MLRLVPYRKHTMDQSFEDMFHMMDDFFKPERTVEKFKLDVSENDQAYLVEAEVPGVEREQITIDYDEDVLLIKVEQKEVTEEKERNYIRRERHASSMERALRFKGVDFEAVQAKLENGILKVAIPKVQEIAKKKIEIQ